MATLVITSSPLTEAARASGRNTSWLDSMVNTASKPAASSERAWSTNLVVGRAQHHLRVVGPPGVQRRQPRRPPGDVRQPQPQQRPDLHRHLREAPTAAGIVVSDR